MKKMKLTKKLEKEIRELYNTYWDGYMKGDMDKFSVILDEDVKVIGSTEGEVFFNKQEALSFYLPTAGQIAGKAELRNRIISIEAAGNLVLVTEQNDFYILIADHWTFYAKGRLSTFFHKKDGDWRIIQQHGSMPDIRAVEGEQFALEKISKENLELRDAVKRRTTELEQKNRELEIEASLERVRTVAMGMIKADDMLDVCRIISTQMGLLSPADIRNVQTAIFYPEKMTYRNYEYYRRHDKTMVTDVDYTTDKRSSNFSAKMQSGAGEFFTDGLSGKAVQDWYEFQKTTAQFPDFYLETATSLTYYWFSLGPVALGCSSYTPLTEEEISLFKKFRNVFELAYRRFLDIQQAVAQAREAQIELGLERVRARAMAMQKSDELKELIGTVFTELIKLDFVLTRCLIMIYDPATKGSTWWMANSEAPSDPIGLFVQHHELPPYLAYVKAWQERNPRWQYVLEGKIKEEWDDYLFSQTELAQLPDFVIDGMKAPDKVILSSSFNNFGNLTLATLETLSEEHFDIMLRFARVFDLTYTRFNDLLKAESQAKESRIEASLERVRSATNAMHQSVDLLKVISILSEQFEQLGFKIHSANFNTSYRQKDWNLWLYNPGVAMFPDQIHVPYFDHPYFNRTLDSLAKGNDFTELVFNKQEKDSFLDHLYKNTIARHVTEERRKWTYDKPGFAWSVVYLANTAITVANYDAEPYTEEQNVILRRFGNVFEQTYTRFLDLQKAEAQAREAKIEASLERVRSKAMAMHNSQDLANTIGVFYRELQSFSITPRRCGVGLLDREERMGEMFTWNTTEQGESLELVGRLKLVGHPVLNKVYESWIAQTEYHPVLKGKEITEYYKVIRPQMAFPDYEHDVVQYGYFFFFKEGGVYAWTEKEMKEDELQIYRRFTSVLSLTYKRYRDLQQAEGSARESQIQLALERVRARTMAMQKSEELADAAVVLFQQFAALGEIPDRISIGLVDKQTDTTDVWATDQAGTQINIRFKARNDERTTIEKMMKAWEAGEKSLIIDLQGDDLKNWIVYLRTELGMSINDENFHGRRLHNISFFSQGWLNITTMEPLPAETLTLLNRFAAVFNLTYTRFNDLQVAEAQTQKAKVETALERVRARALAMQQPEELKEVAEVLRHEMGLLGVEELETCSIYINDEQAEKAECWYALKDSASTDKKLVNDHFALNLNDTWVGREMLRFYNSAAKQTSIVMQGEQRKEWIRYCEDNSPPFRGYYGEVIPDRTYHLYKFSHGAIGAAVAAEISNESWDLLQRAASVFSLAYSRFKDLTQARIDLQRLKEEKQRAEDALGELQVTQKQLIQSEKMASLGELTAGIAHEIQNPLNFVNNFSEVSTELLDEMITELDKGNSTDAFAIADDLKQNLEKILHHGKRADGIVKGMLQHSRSSSGVKEPTNINTLADEYLRLAYHGLRAKDKSFNAILNTDYDEAIGSVAIIPQDIGRVILNLITNAFYAVEEKRKIGEEAYKPTVSVSTTGNADKIEVKVKDNGIGISRKVMDKIFQPFFTTKPTGQGTGLGLSLSYDIIKAHGGELKVETKEGEGSEFVISLPV